MYDVIVVGARCAGSPTAMLLARKGYRVLVVDKATFPSDIMSTHVIWQPGVARLREWGLLQKIIDSNCPPIRKIKLDLGEFAITGSPPPAKGISDFYSPRRKVLDKILVDAAVEGGAEVREAFSVDEIIVQDGTVKGIRGRERGGASHTELARITVGADGTHSLVARTVQAATYNEFPPVACWYYTYWSGMPMDGAELYPRDGRMLGGGPTNDGLSLVFVGWTAAEFPVFRADIEGNYFKTLELAPGLAERVRNAKREEKFIGTVDVPNFFRKPFGPGWALAGDAGYHKDPVTARGITDALEQAEFLADAIDAGLSGREPLQEALAGYENRRNESVMPMYYLTLGFAKMAPPPPEMQKLFSALRTNQAEADRYFGTLAGTVPIPEYFAPENLGRIIAAAS